MADQTLERLWGRYLDAWNRLVEEEPGTGAWREAERQVGQLRDRLVINYSPLVKYVASRVGARLASGAVEQEDMISWGVLGLLEAIESYDPNRPGKKARFESYAISKIRWSILDEVRSQDWVPRRHRLRAQEIESATTRLVQDLWRSPTEEEVAEEVGMGVREYRCFLEQYQKAQIGSLEARAEVEEGFGMEYGALIQDVSAADPQANANLEEIRDQLTGAIGELEKRERLVATFYFYEGLTLKEIGKALDLTEGRISQILRGALSKLRERLKGSTLAAGGWREHLG